MPTLTKQKPKIVILNNSNGSTDIYHKLSKTELIKEIISLKVKINHYENTEKERKIKQTNCLSELENILKK